VPSVSIPRIGLGTWENRDPVKTPQSIAEAIKIGYRHIDDAQMYFNEELVGKGIRESGVPREELFIATKVSPSFLKPDDVKRTTKESLRKLGLDYLDLLYVHWPAETYDAEATIGAFDELQDEGVTRHIAVSNFTPKLLDEARAVAKHELVANQVEMHPLLQQREMVEYVQKHDMYLVAYSPLARGGVGAIPEVSKIAKKHKITEAQVCLAWLLSKKNVITIPKAASTKHLQENLGSLKVKLDRDDIHLIESIDREERIVDPYFAPEW
jgi:2,5-diketo-D-gluconate reductase B